MNGSRHGKGTAMKRSTTRLALVATAAGLCVSGSAEAATKKAFLSGAVPKAPASKTFEATVVAYQLAPGFGPVNVAVAKTGRFRTPVVPGLYAVILNGWVKGKPKSAVRLVGVKAGKTVAVPALKAIAAGPAPPAVRVSVGQMTVTDPSAPSYWNKAAHDILVTDLNLKRPPKCKVTQVEDRKFGRYADILREVRLGKSRFADPSFRAMAGRAEATLKAWAPTHRVSGTIDKVGATSSGTFTLTNTKTGKVEWQQRFEVTGDDAAYQLSEAVAAALNARLCGASKLHVDVSATFTAPNTVFHFEANTSATGTMSYDVVQRTDEPGNYDLPAPADWTITSTTATPNGGECIVTGPIGTRTIPQAAGAGAVIDGQNATVFLVPAIAVLYGLVSPNPPTIDCPTAGDMVTTLGAAPGLQIPTVLGVPKRVTGGNGLGTYDVTVTVTPVTN